MNILFSMGLCVHYCDFKFFFFFISMILNFIMVTRKQKIIMAIALCSKALHYKYQKSIALCSNKLITQIVLAPHTSFVGER
jgi:hypothetical protein